MALQKRTHIKHCPALTNPAGTPQRTFQNLPKNIFQTHASATLPVGACDAMATWADLNPDWNYHFFDHDDQRDFIQNHFSNDVLAAYDQLIPGAYRADLWRYCVLYTLGGIYADHKLMLHQSLNTLLPENIGFLAFKDLGRDQEPHRAHNAYAWQGVLAAPPKHPFLKRAIDDIVHHIQNGYYGYDPLSITGPCLLGEAINATLGQANDRPIAVGHHEDPAYDIQPTPNFQDESSITLFGHADAIRVYPGYLKDRAAMSLEKKDAGKTDYVAAWFTGNVYNNKKCTRDPNSLYYKNRLNKFYRNHVKSAYKARKKTLARNRLKAAIRAQGLKAKFIAVWLQYDVLSFIFNRASKH
jgi:hypothetical protein